VGDGDWNINIEIEPESWEVVRQRDPEGYEAFKRLFKDHLAGCPEEITLGIGRVYVLDPPALHGLILK